MRNDALKRENIYDKIKSILNMKQHRRTAGLNKEDIMEQYKQEFIDFMVESDVLKFGDFTLKSGRKSPFFMNAGAYVTGTQLARLGEYYAKAIHETYGDDFDVLFGPAYKGIPISVVTAVAYAKLYGKEVRYCSDRKEEKDHGADKGGFLGSKLKDGDMISLFFSAPAILWYSESSFTKLSPDSFASFLVVSCILNKAVASILCKPNVLLYFKRFSHV